MPEIDLVAVMKEKAAAVQTVVADAGDLTEVFRYTVDLTAQQGGRTLAAPGLNPDEEAALKELCQARGIELLAGSLRPHLKAIHTTLTRAQWGVAETGTLVLDSTAEDTRIATMLSETHVAYVPVNRIQPDTMALEGALNELMKAPPRYLAFISGASRTADIERVLTIGVHGPQELHILFLEQTGDSP